MTSSILLLKIGGSIGAASVVAGGSYVAYQNSDSIKKFFRTQQQEPATSPEKAVTPVQTNLFLVRYKEAKASNASITKETTLTCDFDQVTNTPCKIYKFATVKTENHFTTSEIAGLVIPTNTSDFTDNTYFVIELTNLKKTAAELHNKTFTVKSGATTQGKFDFDQIIIGEAKKEGNPDTPTEETYIVKKSNDWTAITDTLTSYRCKFSATSGDSKIDNYDSKCKLIKITPTTTTDKITGFADLKSLSTAITAAAFKDDTDNYYKLTVNSKLLYNLSFTEDATASLQIEFIKNGGSSLGKFDIKQKFVDDKFIGKTDLLLAKVTKNDTALTGALTEAKCNLTKAENGTAVDASTQLPCSLYSSTLTEGQALKDLTVGQTAVATTTENSSTFAVDSYYLIKLNDEKKIADFDGKTQIFYQIADTATGSPSHKQIELNIVALMSGEFTADKKPTFITEPKTTTPTKTQE